MVGAVLRVLKYWGNTEVGSVSWMWNEEEGLGEDFPDGDDLSARAWRGKWRCYRELPQAREHSVRDQTWFFAEGLFSAGNKLETKGDHLAQVSTALIRTAYKCSNVLVLQESES